MAAVYLIASYDIVDPERYEGDYVPAVARSIAAAGGEVVVATGRGRALEGEPGGHTVVLRFASDADLRRWYEAPEHAAVLALRRAVTARATVVAVDEFPATAAPATTP